MNASGVPVILAFFLLGVVLGLSIGKVYQTTHKETSGEIVVFAGAAAAPVYREAAELFESRYGVRVVLHIGGSGALLSAIEVTQTGDLYIPGSQEYLFKAKEKDIVDFSNYPPKILAYLVPAIIVQKDNPKNIKLLEDLSRPGLRVGIGDPKIVCVGAYAKEILENNGLWESVSKNIVAYASSCEDVARMVFTGAVDAVIGWHVFYYWSPDKSEIIWIDPEKIHKIGYIGGAVTKYSKNPELAYKFLEFLTSDEVSSVWRKYGYYATIDEAKQHAPQAIVEGLE